MSIKEKISKSLSFSRTPVVAVLGHVDHGKTTLLDAIRNSSIVTAEHGGITQHIGAYQIEYKGKKITFIDTPGHAAFAKMRSHGVAVTDLVVLVVAANDGVKPQTKEAILHIKQAKCPYLIAINKIDLPQASCDLVRSQLSQVEVLVEGYGGDIVCVEISAKEKKGIDDLLEMILLLAEMQNLKADPQGPLEAVVIDSSLDTKKGVLATLLVKNGTLKIGSQIYADDVYAKVKLMTDEYGQKILTALPGKPVQVLGFKKVPDVGAKVTSEQTVKEVKEAPKLTEVEETGSKEQEDKEKPAKFKIILKTDTSGTLEAITSNLASEIEL